MVWYGIPGWLYRVNLFLVAVARVTIVLKLTRMHQMGQIPFKFPNLYQGWYTGVLPLGSGGCALPRLPPVSHTTGKRERERKAKDKERGGKETGEKGTFCFIGVWA